MKPSLDDVTLPVGFQLGGYRIDDVLGAGAFGIVYLATVGETFEQYAVKEYFPRDSAKRNADQTVSVISSNKQADFDYSRNLFVKEAQFLASLNHPAFVRHLDDFEAMGTHYLVMSYEPGCTLQDFIQKEGAMDEESMLKFILPLLDGLEILHSRGYIHRDIKPQNVLVGQSGHAVLMDFGAAMQIDNQLSVPPDGIFSEHFAPIEQYENDGGMGPWTDIYAVAAVIYYMLTGEKPAKATDRKRKGKNITSLAASQIEGYHPSTLTAVDASLALDPRKRTPSASRFARLLRRTAVDEFSGLIFKLTSTTQWWSHNNGPGVLNPKRLSIGIFVILVTILLAVVLAETV